MRLDGRFMEPVPQAYTQEILQYLEVGLQFLLRFGLWALMVSCCRRTQDLASGSTTSAGTSASLVTAACLCCCVGRGPGSGADVPYMALKMLFKAAKRSRSLWYLRLGCLANGCFAQVVEREPREAAAVSHEELSGMHPATWPF